jgi:hypothetical protein
MISMLGSANNMSTTMNKLIDLGLILEETTSNFFMCQAADGPVLYECKPGIFALRSKPVSEGGVPY